MWMPDFKFKIIPSMCQKTKKEFFECKKGKFYIVKRNPISQRIIAKFLKCYVTQNYLQWFEFLKGGKKEKKKEMFRDLVMDFVINTFWGFLGTQFICCFANKANSVASTLCISYTLWVNYTTDNAHNLFPQLIADCRTWCRILHERFYIEKNVDTISEPWVYLNVFNKNWYINYQNRGTKLIKTWFNVYKKSFSTGFLIVASFAYSSKLKIRWKVKIIKINFAYYKKYILLWIFKHEIPSFYPHGSNLLNCILSK